MLWVLRDLRFLMCLEYFRILYFWCVLNTSGSYISDVFWVLPNLRFPSCFWVLRVLKYAMATFSQQHTIHNFLVVYHSWAMTTQSLKWLSVGWTTRFQFLAETAIFLLLTSTEAPEPTHHPVKCKPGAVYRGERVPKHKIDWLPPFKNARL